jgi:hypothetical protein
MKLLIMQVSPTCCHLIPLRSKYSPQHPVLKHPQPRYHKQKASVINSVELGETKGLVLR